LLTNKTGVNLLVSIFPLKNRNNYMEGRAMQQSKTPGRKSFVLAAISMFAFLGVHVQIAQAAESGCVTCHLDKEMLQKNITVAAGQKSAMQSGAG
jgi:hypothetical protein